MNEINMINHIGRKQIMLLQDASGTSFLNMMTGCVLTL